MIVEARRSPAITGSLRAKFRLVRARSQSVRKPANNMPKNPAM